jgi:DNA-binding MarR family transcriptional regulator
MMLRRHPNVTQSVLARIMGIEVPTAFHLVLKLEQNGYVARAPDDADRRAQLLRLTSEGERILRVIAELTPARDTDLLAGFAPEEREILARLLTRIIVRGSEHLGISQQVVVAPTMTLESSVAGESVAQVAEFKAESPRKTRIRPRKWALRPHQAKRLRRER